PAPVSFRSTDVLRDTNILGGHFGEYYLNLPGNGGLHEGDLVVYETNATRSSPINNLFNGKVYVVHLRFLGGVQLIDPDGGLAIGAPDTDAGRSATEELRRLPIGGLQDGHTYYVTNATGGSFQLADTPEHASQGIALSIDASDTSGQHQIGRNGIALLPASGTQYLRFALTGPATNGPTGDELLAPDGQSLRSLNPPAGGGQSAAIAEGGSGGGIELSFPDATLSTDPTVKAYVAARQVNAGGNVTIAAESFGNLDARANN